MAEAAVDLVEEGMAGPLAGAAPLAITIGTRDAGSTWLVELEVPAIEAAAGETDAAQAHTALAEAFAAEPLTVPQLSRTPDEAAVLIATGEGMSRKIIVHHGD